MVSIGNLSERITLQNETRTPDTGGGASVTWTTLATVFAQVTPMSVSERWQNGQQLGLQSYRFTIRARADLAVAQRLQWRGLTYNIEGFILNDNPRYHDILATTGGAE